MIQLKAKLYQATLACIVLLLGRTIQATETETLPAASAPTLTLALARCYIRYAQDNRPQHTCDIHVKELPDKFFKCSTQNVETKEQLPVCDTILSRLDFLNGGSFPSSLDRGLDRGPHLYIHPRSGQRIDFVLHFDPEASDYAHEWGGPSCTFKESDIALSTPCECTHAMEQDDAEIMHE